MPSLGRLHLITDARPGRDPVGVARAALSVAGSRLVVQVRVADAGADYLGVGPCFTTATKAGLPAPIGPAGVRRVAASVDVPVIAIGGVTAAAVPSLLAAGAYGVAVVGAIGAAADPARAAGELLGALP